MKMAVGLISIKSMKTIKLYWSSSLKRGRQNVGDSLSPLLVEAISNKSVVHASSTSCDLVAVGSLLQRLKHHFWNRRVHVWGTGFIAQQKCVPNHHYYHAVRGFQSAALIKNAHMHTFGDPGLLVDRLLPDYASVHKKYHIGIIPHYKDQENVNIAKFMERMPHVLFIDILNEPMTFLREVASCEFILSSSLHGLIVADAFHIPNAWIELSQEVKGGGFKFQDYYSVFRITPEAQQLEKLHLPGIEKIAAAYSRPGLAQIQTDLVNSFPVF